MEGSSGLLEVKHAFDLRSEQHLWSPNQGSRDVTKSLRAWICGSTQLDLPCQRHLSRDFRALAGIMNVGAVFIAPASK